MVKLLFIMPVFHLKTPGSHIPLQMKLPSSLGQKKTKAIEQVLDELGIGKWHGHIRSTILGSLLLEGISWVVILFTNYEISFKWMSQDFIDDKSTSVQVMAWYCEAASHYLIQCWRRSSTPYGITNL